MDDSEDDQLKIIQKKLRNDSNNKKINKNLVQKKIEVNNIMNEYSVATSMFTSKNEMGNNISDKMEIAGNMKNIKQNFPKKQGNLLFNENNNISQINLNENSNPEIKEEYNEPFNQFNPNYLNNDNVDNVNYNNINIISNNLDENQMDNLQNDMYNYNINQINNYNMNNYNKKVIQLDNNKYKSKTTKNKNRKNSSFVPKTQQNQIMNYNLINVNSNQNQIIPPIINNPMFLNNPYPYILNSDMNNQIINNQPIYYPSITPLPPIPQHNYSYPNMNDFNNNNYYYNEPETQMFNQDMPPPLLMQNDNQNKNKFNGNKLKNKFRNKNKSQEKNNIINKKNIIKGKNKIIPIKNSPNKNQEEKEQKDSDKEKQNNNNEEIQKDISKDISEIKPEESKLNANKSIETDKLEDKSISYQIGYLNQLKRNQQKKLNNLEEKQRRLFKINAKIKKYDIQNEIKLGKIYTTFGQKRPKKYKTTSIHREKINNNYNNMFNINRIDNNNFNNNKNIDNNDELNLENLLLKKMQFDKQIDEIKKFIQK